LTTRRRGRILRRRRLGEAVILAAQPEPFQVSKLLQHAVGNYSCMISCSS
jgi:hypothetical protein